MNKIDKSEDKEKAALHLLLERILWNQRLLEEQINLIILYFKNTDIMLREKRATKPAILAAIHFLKSITPLQSLYYASGIDKTGGIMLVKDDGNPDIVICTEKGYLLQAKEDIRKYMEHHKI